MRSYVIGQGPPRRLRWITSNRRPARSRAERLTGFPRRFSLRWRFAANAGFREQRGKESEISTPAHHRSLYSNPTVWNLDRLCLSVSARIRRRDKRLEIRRRGTRYHSENAPTGDLWQAWKQVEQ